MSVVSEKISGVEVGPIPLGELILGLSHTSPDNITQQTLNNIQSTLKSGSVLDLDAHRNFFDIMSTMCALSLELGNLEFITGLMAAKWTKSVLGGALFESINQSSNLKIINVVRGEDKKYIGEDLFDQRKKDNRNALHRFSYFLNKHNAIGNMAAYGSRFTFLMEEKIRFGVIRLVKKYPFFCSLSKSSLINPFGFETHLSSLIDLRGETSKKKIRQCIQINMEDLYNRVTG